MKRLVGMKMFYDLMKNMPEGPLYFELYREDYALPANEEVNKTVRSVMLGKVSRALPKMYVFNATPEEIARMVKFGFVCIDANKYHLNILAADEDLQAWKLFEKYLKGAKDKCKNASSTSTTDQS